MNSELQKWYKALEEADRKAETGDEQAKKDAYEIADTIRQLEAQGQGGDYEASLTTPVVIGGATALPAVGGAAVRMIQAAATPPAAKAPAAAAPAVTGGLTQEDIDLQRTGTLGPGGSGRARNTTYNVQTAEMAEMSNEQKAILKQLREKGIIDKPKISRIAGSTPAGVVVTDPDALIGYGQTTPPKLTAAQRASMALSRAPAATLQGIKNLPGAAVRGAANVPGGRIASGYSVGALGAETYNYNELAKEAESRGDTAAANYYKAMALVSGAGTAAGGIGAVSKTPRGRALALPAAGLAAYNYLQSQRGYPAPGQDASAPAVPSVSQTIAGRAEGGLAHLSKGRQVKEAFEYGGKQLGKLSDWAQNYINSYFVPTQSDRMRYVGGPSFSANQLARPEYKNIVWGSGKPGTATGIANLAKDSRFGGVENQIFAPLLGEAKMHQSNQMIFDRMVEEFFKNPEKLTPELRQTINDYIRSGGLTVGGAKKSKSFEPIEGFDVADRQMIENLGKTFDNRKLIAQHAFGGKDIGGRKAQIIPYEKILQETTDPTVLGAPTFSMGPRAFKLTGETLDVPRPDLNAAFPYKLFGQDLGVTYPPVPSELSLMDWQRQWRQDTGKTMPLKSGKLPQPGYYEHTVGYTPAGSSERIYPRQKMTEDWVKELQRSGFKTGGLSNIK